MNKELYKYMLESEEAVIDINEGNILFESGLQILIVDQHDQDCCEYVYADWSSAKYVLDHLKGKKISEVVIKGIEGEGFLICFNDSFQDGAKVFIPCYNDQNGYYSSDLSLLITVEGKEISIDISDYKKDRIG